MANRLEREFGTPITSFLKIGEFVDWEKGEARGSGVSRVYLIELAGNPREDERHIWYLVNKLPEVTVDQHRLAIIPMAVKSYEVKQ